MSKIKIVNADCKEILKKIPNSSIDLILTDPPYLTTKEKWDKEEVFNEEIVKELFRVAKDSCSIYVWCGIGEKSQSLIRWFPLLKRYFHFKDLITWKKQRGIGMRRGWLYTREEIMWFVKDNKKFIWNKKEQYSDEKRKFSGTEGNYYASKNKRITNIWMDIPDNYMSHGLHFTSKPLKAIERIIKLHTKENDIVLDPFLGSGTTAVVCKQLNRNCIGVELNKEYCEIAKRRIEENK